MRTLIALTDVRNVPDLVNDCLSQIINRIIYNNWHMLFVSLFDNELYENYTKLNEA